MVDAQEPDEEEIEIPTNPNHEAAFAEDTRKSPAYYEEPDNFSAFMVFLFD